MPGPETPAPKRRPGGRTARNRNAVLDAALARLIADGYDHLSIGAVAADAGVAETTVYRHWPTKAHLAAAALAQLADAENPTPDTGTLDGDLRTILTQVVELIRRPEVEHLIRTLAGLSNEIAGMRDARDAFRDTRVAGMQTILDRAVERGEIHDGASAAILLETLVAPAYLRLLITGTPLDNSLIEPSVKASLALTK